MAMRDHLYIAKAQCRSEDVAARDQSRAFCICNHAMMGLDLYAYRMELLLCNDGH